MITDKLPEVVIRLDDTEVRSCHDVLGVFDKEGEVKGMVDLGTWTPNQLDEMINYLTAVREFMLR